MKRLLACLSAEMVKHRKSWPLLAAVLAPICLVGFLAVIFWYSDAVVVRFQPGVRFWLDLNVASWNLFVMPVTAAIMADLSWAQDRDANAWRHLLHQPAPRPYHYFAKLLNLSGLLLLSQVMLFAVVLLVWPILTKNENLHPIYHGHMDMALYWEFACFSIIASIPVMSFQTWFSFRLPGAGPALGMAIVGTWGAMKLIGVTSLLQFLPWGLSSHAATIFFRYKKVAWQYFPWKFCYGALALAFILIIFGSFDFARHAYTKSMEKN